MKKIIIILILLIAFWFFFVKEKDMTKEQMVGEEISICYVWNTEAGDNASLYMNFSGEGGKDVNGTFNWYPAMTDSKVGDFVGVAGSVDPESMARQMNGFWDTLAEGMNTTEEIKINFGEGVAQVAFGEMVDRGDGVYVYKNPEDLYWGPNLSQTSCDDEALR